MAASSSASALMFQVDDQTDEDFFDKLVDDEFGVTGFVDGNTTAANFTDPGNYSLGGSGFALELEDGHDSQLKPSDTSKTVGTTSSLSFQKDLLEEENVVLGKDFRVVERSDSVTEPVKSIVFDKVIPYDDHPSKAGKDMSGLPDSSKVSTIDGGSTNINEVQWTAFTNVGEQPNFAGFGSYLDFIAEESSGFSEEVTESSGRVEDGTKADLNNTWFGSVKQEEEIQFWEKASRQATLCSTALTQPDSQPEYSSSSQQQDVQPEYPSSSQQQDVQSSLDPNDPHYWEKLYPGWKYDFITGQWYQVTTDDLNSISQVGSSETAVVTTDDSSQTNAELSCNDAVIHSHESVSNFNTKLDSYESASVDSEKIWQTAASEMVSVQTSNVSYQQQNVQSVTTSVAESSTLGNMYDFNNVTQEATEYPSNMIFDPQYPGWYYDVNTQQWHSLESYLQLQSTQVNTMTVQNNLTSGNGTTSDSYFLEQSCSVQSSDVNQFEIQKSLDQISQEFGTDYGGTLNNYSQQNIWQPEALHRQTSLPDYKAHQKSLDFSAGSQVAHHSGSDVSHTNEGSTIKQSCDHTGISTIQNFVPPQNLYHYNQPNMEQKQLIDTSISYYGNQSTMYPQQSFQSGSLSHSQFSYSPAEGRTSAGRPPHALVCFGFGGKILVVKHASCSTNSIYANQDGGGGIVSILNMMDVIMDKNEDSCIGRHGLEYFQTLCKQSFPGPLVSGNAASKDLNKWIDERVSLCTSSMDFRKGELLRLLLSLLKISLHYYGKIRSPFGTDPSSLESDTPESAVTKLFASSKKDGTHTREYGAFTHCIHNLPTEGQIRATAAEVQTLLVSGKRKEALQCAQEGMLWGPALVLAAQLGEKFYVDTVKQMAHRQFLSGAPLRTLCLLIAGQPADVFSDGTGNSSPNKVDVPQQQGHVLTNGMLDDWEENLAVICANRTKDDELVIVHLGDCLWKERGEITAAHTCYLVAEANFESYSDSARLCLVGADHMNCPRTYTSPEAIQRTEFYEYSKVLGNSQFQLLTFQPYKLIYAYMLAEVGKVSDSLRYCQAILKLLKNPGRSTEVELWKAAASSLEERLRMHQQGGYGTSLAPAKLVGKLFTSIDKSIHRMIGAPPPLPSMPENKVQSNEHDGFSMVPKVTSSQSTTTMTSLVPSASVEAISEWSGRGRHNIQNRSVSEPDFNRTPKESQVNPSNDAKSADEKSKASSSGGSSRFGSLGSSLFQKTIGWVSRGRTGRQAKLGQENKFYYDEKLKRWVEEGAALPPEEAAPPPPPTMASFQNGVSDYNINSALKSQNSLPNGEIEAKPSTTLQHHSGIPPIPTSSQNQFSARGRMGVRSRYVDTFNKTGGAVKSSFQAPATQSTKLIGSAGTTFFVPSPVSTTTEIVEDATESVSEASSSQSLSSATPLVESSFPSLSSPPPSLPMQRFASMDNITPSRNKDAMLGTASGNPSFLGHSRAASWSGSLSDPAKTKTPGSYTSANKIRSPLSSSPDGPRPQIRDFSQSNGGGFGDELHEVEL